MTVAPNRKVLVTGGASGFGLGLARRLADHGAGVVIGDISAEGLARARHDDPRLTPVQVDVTDAASVHAAAKQAEDHLGGLDTLAICAGVIHVKPFEEVAEADWDTTLSINLKGAFLTAQAAMPALRASGRGRVVAISSDAGRRGYPWIQAYAASKAGLIGLMQSIAIEVAADRVTVNCVCPASCPTTGMGRSLTEWKAKRVGKSVEDMLADIAATFPLGRYVHEEDVISAMEYFISDEGSFLTGVSLDIDGGESLGFLQVPTV